MTAMTRKSIYVTRQGARVHKADGLVAVTLDRAVVDRWLPEEIDRVLVFGNVQVTTQVLGLLLRHGISVAFFSSSGRYRGQLVSPESGNVFLRLAQHARHRDGAFRLAFARGLVASKLRDGRTLVRRFARNHPGAERAMDDAAESLGAALDRAESVSGVDELRGVEGAAAARYFEAFGAMVRPPLAFARRTRRPARDPVNALLNLGYTLLAHEIAGRLEATGFDPRVGYYHGVRYGRSSLALDLLEAHRVSVVDRLTLSIVNRRMLGPEDFVDKGGTMGVRLAPKALRRYLDAYEAAMGEPPPEGDTPRARLETQIAELRARVMGDSTAAGTSEAS